MIFLEFARVGGPCKVCEFCLENALSSALLDICRLSGGLRRALLGTGLIAVYDELVYGKLLRSKVIALGLSKPTGNERFA